MPRIRRNMIYGIFRSCPALARRAARHPQCHGEEATRTGGREWSIGSLPGHAELRLNPGNRCRAPHRTDPLR